MLARNSLGFMGMAAVLLLPWISRANEPRLEFAKTARDIRQGIFLVGSPEAGTGTAWVISKKHRLLATNAHVADMFTKAPAGKFLAMMNNSDQTYVVTKAWYHPGVKRYATKDENLSLRSNNPLFGPVDPLCPDVAVLQLAAEGPDLPVELKRIAGPKVLFDLQALPVAILGYPSHDTAFWPGKGKKAQATFHVGVISRVSDFQTGRRRCPGRAGPAAAIHHGKLERLQRLPGLLGQWRRGRRPQHGAYRHCQGGRSQDRPWHSQRFPVGVGGPSQSFWIASPCRSPPTSCFSSAGPIPIRTSICGRKITKLSDEASTLDLRQARICRGHRQVRRGHQTISAAYAGL